MAGCPGLTHRSSSSRTAAADWQRPARPRPDSDASSPSTVSRQQQRGAYRPRSSRAQCSTRQNSPGTAERASRKSTRAPSTAWAGPPWGPSSQHRWETCYILHRTLYCTQHSRVSPGTETCHTPHHRSHHPQHSRVSPGPETCHTPHRTLHRTQHNRVSPGPETCHTAHRTLHCTQHNRVSPGSETCHTPHH